MGVNLETAVGCARVCRERRAGQGETKQRTVVRNEEQRSPDRRARCNRVHSAVTKKVKVNEGRKVNIHAALEMFTSGQLLFLGLWTSPVVDLPGGLAGALKRNPK